MHKRWEVVYDAGKDAEPPSLSGRCPASAPSSTYLSSSSSAPVPAGVSVGSPLCISFSKYFGSNLIKQGHAISTYTLTMKRGGEGKVDALYTTPFPLGRLIPLTLFDNMLRARRLSIFLAQQPACHTLPQPSALGRQLLRYRPHHLGHRVQRPQIDQRRPLFLPVALFGCLALRGAKGSRNKTGRCR